MDSMMQIAFTVLRQNRDKAPYVQRYELEVSPSTTVLDCLNQIKWEQDGTLAFRKNCRNTICGSCSMRINGRSALACKENVGKEVERLERMMATGESLGTPGSLTKDGIPTIAIAPMGNMPVIKDLIVDMNPFWDHLEAVDPYVSTQARQISHGEFRQLPEERDRLNQTGNCILCGACYSECNAREVNPDFVGPHALAKAQRIIADSRESNVEARIEQYGEGTQGVWGCTRCYYCNTVCPMGVAPMDQISAIKQEVLSRNDAQASRSIRHRKVLIDLVKQGGWVDERKFGLRVVGNYFRDIKGLASLGPLGLRMMLKGKFPLTFDPSEGTQTVRALIEDVQRKQAK
jgi:succinate dehydrogenase / fumarate reductase iron-sulfur subunit